MDNLTHSLVGALIGQAGLKKKTGLAMPALIIGANIPDVDAACLLWLDGVQHLGFRRGITHGPIAWVLLPLLLAGALWWFDRWQTRRGTRPEGRLPVSFRWLFALAFIGCLTHPALDWLNVYGIRLLEPFSHRWFYGDTLFIIDVWLWAIMGVGVWLSLRREKRGGEWMRPARIAIVVALGYIGLNWIITYSEEVRLLKISAIEGEDAIASPVPIAFWERELLVGRRNNWRRVLFTGQPYPEGERLSFYTCIWPAPEELRGKQIESFLFWSRAPFAERAADGSIVFRDARYYDPRARDRFSVPLKDFPCEANWRVGRGL